MTTSEAFEFVTQWLDSFASELEASSYRIQHCIELEATHEEIPRVHAHVFHHDGVICLVQDFELLADEHKIGIILHEFGHIFAPSMHDSDADLWVESFCGIDIDYVDTMQWVEPALLWN